MSKTIVEKKTMVENKSAAIAGREQFELIGVEVRGSDCIRRKRRDRYKRMTAMARWQGRAELETSINVLNSRNTRQ
jgi:hypothetical protein